MSATYVLKQKKSRPKQINSKGKVNAFLGTLVTLHEDQTCFTCGKTLKKGTLALRKLDRYYCAHSHKKRVKDGPLPKLW
jgi:formamidopyrimidine-DNA glycosylase